MNYKSKMVHMKKEKMKNVSSNKKNTLNESDEIEVFAQSPIELSDAQSIVWQPKKPLTFKNHWNQKGKANIINNGVSAILTFVNKIERPIVSGGPLKNEYLFEQLHFHWADDNEAGSEHSINGIKYAAEAHLVHYNSKYSGFEEAYDKSDGLTVTGFLLKVTEVPNKSFQTLSDAILEIGAKEQSHNLTSDCLKWMLSSNLNDYYTYKGSLTTEPYKESVTWIVYTIPVEISENQLKGFRQMEGKNPGKRIQCNARPIQSRPTGLQVHRVKHKNNISIKRNTRSKRKQTNTVEK